MAMALVPPAPLGPPQNLGTSGLLGFAGRVGRAVLCRACSVARMRGGRLWSCTWRDLVMRQEGEAEDDLKH